MRCLNPSETIGFFGKDGFSINIDQAWYRIALVLEPRLTKTQHRVGGGHHEVPIDC
jgi:hypothetical protein